MIKILESKTVKDITLIENRKKYYIVHTPLPYTTSPLPQNHITTVSYVNTDWKK